MYFYIYQESGLSKCRVNEVFQIAEYSRNIKNCCYRCYLNSLLRNVTDNSSQMYSDRYIVFRVGASKYFLTGTTLHIETSMNFRRN